jgi:Lon protease-like protein
MFLSEAALFPGCYLPLFIFEDRYRQMLQHALDTDRMFCIGTRIGSETEHILPWSTVGLIRACVRQPDGTSHLMLYGLRRVDLNGWRQKTPFAIAEVSPIEPLCSVEPGELAKLRDTALSLVPRPEGANADMVKKLAQTLSETSCSERVCDMLSYFFVRDQEAVAKLLSEPDIAERYRLLIGELGKRKAEA